MPHPARARRRDTTRAAAAALLVLAATSLPAIAASNDPSLGPEASLPPGVGDTSAGWPGATAEERERAPRPGRDDLVRAHAELTERERRRSEARSSSEGQSERARSRSAYRGLDRSRAVAVLREKFAGVGGHQKPLLDPPAGYRIAGFNSDSVARLAPADGGPQVLVASDVPLRRANGAGEKPLVDLTPVDRELGFEPRHPLVPLRLPRLAAQGIALGRDAHVRAAFDSPGAVPTATGMIEEGDVFYHDVAPDTDLVVTPRPLGFQTFTQLRSPASPEQFSLRFTLPDGAVLRTRGDGGATITAGSEELLEISRPEALDAQGERLPAAYVVAGDALEVRVAHRERDVAYPVVVDPVVDIPGGGGRGIEERWADPSWYTGGWSVDVTGWLTRSYWSGDGTHYWDRRDWPFAFCPTYCSGVTDAGLYVRAYQDSYYPSYTQGEWYYPTWGDVYIPRAEFYYVGHYPNASFVRTSIWSGTLNRYVALKDFPDNPWYTAPHWTGIASSSDWTHGTSASINLVLPAPAGGSSTPFRAEGPVAYLGGARMYLQDRSAPARPAMWDVNSEPYLWQRGWVDRLQGTMFAKSKDAGLGVKRFRFRYPTGEQWRTHPCSGDRKGRCPGSPVNAVGTSEGFAWTHANLGFAGDPFTFDTGAWPEGVHTISMEAIDPTDRYSPAQTQKVSVDHYAPDITIGGVLGNAANGTLPAGAHELTVGIQDWYSGIDSVRLYIDENEVAFSPACSGGATEWGCGFIFDTNRYGIGTHKFKVVARDKLASSHPTHERVRQFEVTFGPPPDYDECRLEIDDADYCAVHDRGGMPPEGSDPIPTSSGLQTMKVEDEPDFDESQMSTAQKCADLYGPLSTQCDAEDTVNPASDDSLLAQYSQLNTRQTSNGTQRTYGVADDGAAAFASDQRFFDLDVRIVRRNLPYNIMERQDSDVYREFKLLYHRATNNADVHPNLNLMVSFQRRDANIGEFDDSERACRSSDVMAAPSKTEFLKAIWAFELTFPEVNIYSAWNEPNHTKQPTREPYVSAGVRCPGVGAAGAARYTYLLQTELCNGGRCEVVAGDFAQLERAKWREYATRYLTKLRDLASDRGISVPRKWGLHPYTDVRQNPEDFSPRAPYNGAGWFSSSLVPSGLDIWFTEVGSRVDHGKNTQVSQSAEVEHLLTNVADAGRGAKRLYYYQFREPSLIKARIFDSGLLAPDDPHISQEMPNAPRIAYDSYRAVTNP